MAEDKPSFDAEMQKRAIDWVNEKCGEITCECCKSTQWSMLPEITAIPIFRERTMLGGMLSPMFMIVCSNCGNTKLFNALISKVLPIPKAEEVAKVEEEKKEAKNG